MNTVSERLNLARKELLDLSLKNPLINYKLRVSSGFEFPFLNPEDVFNYLVNEGKKSYFTTEKSNNPAKLYTLLTDKELHQKLIRTFRSSKMYIEEKGANILFLALGFLRWKVDDEDENFYRSPLLLVPVEFKKVENLDRFYIQYSGEEIRLNISLITKLNSEFGINIDYEYEGEIEGINEYLRKVDEIVSTSSKAGWQVESCCGAFDFFSFAKFLMYRDLDLSVWSNGNNKKVNPVLNKLFITNFSDKKGTSQISDDNFSPYKLFNVVDADSSQASVISQINDGRNMVIQGPPGTGKSQTITNIIASSIANNKSVLFVAEKKAALDVVKNRLERVGLGDLVLELHSYKTNKTTVLKSIESTLNLGAPKVIDDEQLRLKYSSSKNEIDEYRDIINKTIANSNLTLVDVYGNILKIKDKADSENFRLPRIDFDCDISLWSDKEFDEKISLTREYILLLKQIGKIEKHPFYGVELKKCMPYEQVTIKEKIYDLEDSLESLVSVIDDIDSVFSSKTVATLFDSTRLINSINALEKYKELSEVRCKDISFFINSHEIENIIKAGKEAVSFKKCINLYKANSYLDYNRYIKLYEDYNKRRDINKEQKEKIKSELTSFLADGKYSRDNLFKFYEFEINVKLVLDNEAKISSLFPNIYRGLFNTDWNKIKRLLVPAKDFSQLIENFNILSQTKNLVGDEDTIVHLLELKEEYLQKKNDYELKVKELSKVMALNSIKKFNQYDWHSDMNFSDLKKIISIWKNKSDSVIEIVRYNELIEKFNNLGLKPLLDYYYETSKYDNLDDILSNEYYESLINYAYSNFDYISQFKEYKYERLIDNYRSLDIKLMVENIKYILKKHYDNMPRINDESLQMNILRRELQKKKNQMPIKKLFSKTLDVVKKIKPVFMMSPISIASFMPSNSEEFDLVVFDEASQVRPVEAFGALLRSKQIVVVGDSKQLPPTTFFDTMASKYDDVNDEDYDFANMESILSLLLAKNIPENTLTWHYRSKNQSLITVSNNEFYNQSLKVFPSVYDKDPNQGLVYNYMPDTVYDRGASRTNKKEAKAVIKAVFEHIEKYPDMSVGVVSFSLAQQEELYREFDVQRKTHDSEKFARFFDSSLPEPFFIKNLESVQGDERDVIFISVGYGYDSEHKLSMDFGPLNKEGGERRLNVLITRAKYKCIVFSNLTCHDINLSKTSAAGVVALKRFLEYAQNRVIFASKNEKNIVNPFADYISDKLEEYGYNIDRKIGAKVGLDLVIYDKDLDRFTIGIECDGGEQSRDISFATDRERIRPNVLKALGWKLYHIWAPSFYRNPKHEFSKLLDYVQEATKETKEEVGKKENISIMRRKGEKLKEINAFVEYKQYSGPKRRPQILSNIEDLGELITKIVHVESPIHINALKKVLISITNISKLNDEQLNNIIAVVKNNQQIKFVNDFVYDNNATTVEVRNRKDLPKAFKRLDYISDEEYQAFIKKVLTTGDALDKDGMYKCVNDYFGITKSPYSKSAIDRNIEVLLQNKEINIEANGEISLSDF